MRVRVFGYFFGFYVHAAHGCACWIRQSVDIPRRYVPMEYMYHLHVHIGLGGMKGSRHQNSRSFFKISTLLVTCIVTSYEMLVLPTDWSGTDWWVGDWL